MAELRERQFGRKDPYYYFERGWNSGENRQRDKRHTHIQRMSDWTN